MQLPPFGQNVYREMWIAFMYYGKLILSQICCCSKSKVFNFQSAVYHICSNTNFERQMHTINNIQEEAGQFCSTAVESSQKMTETSSLPAQRQNLLCFQIMTVYVCVHVCSKPVLKVIAWLTCWRRQIKKSKCSYFAIVHRVDNVLMNKQNKSTDSLEWNFWYAELLMWKKEFFSY